MESSFSYTSTNIVNEHVEEVVRLYFAGVSVKNALKEVRAISDLKLKLDRLIIEKNYNLTDIEVVRLSQKLDKHIVKEQRKKAALQSNLR